MTGNKQSLNHISQKLEKSFQNGTTSPGVIRGRFLILGFVSLVAGGVSVAFQVNLQEGLYPRDAANSSTIMPLLCTTLDPLRRTPEPKTAVSPFAEPYDSNLVDDCAFVAPDPVLIGADLGPEIDAHDLVFRVARVPREMQIQDLGSRTDVMILDDSTQGMVKYVRPPRDCSGEQCRRTVSCQGSACRFKAVILTSGWSPQAAIRYFGTASYFVASFQKSTQKVLNGLMRVNESADSTTNFLTFWTAVTNCRRLTIYGLMGSHLRSSERKLVKQLLGGAALDWGQRNKKTKCLDRSLLNVHVAIGDLAGVKDLSNSRCKFTDMISEQGPGMNPFRRREPDCALVTSSAFLMGTGMGAQIDKHNMIFRANRLTPPEYAQDFGARTDVIFLNCLNSRSSAVSWMGTAVGENMTNCSVGGPLCDFRTVVLRSCFDNVAKHGTAHGAWGQSPFWVGMQGRNIQDTLCTMTDYELTNPTTGLLALWTAATMCQNLTIYGFRGTGNADGHTSETKHDLETEHRFLGDLASGSVAKLNWTRRTNTNECLDEIFKGFRLIDGDKEFVDKRKRKGWMSTLTDAVTR